MGRVRLVMAAPAALPASEALDVPAAGVYGQYGPFTSFEPQAAFGPVRLETC